MTLLEWDIKGAKVKYELPDGSKRRYRVSKVVGPADTQRIPGLDITVADFFRDNYRTILEWPKMPCLLMGSNENPIPVEFCCLTGKPPPLTEAYSGHKMDEHLLSLFTPKDEAQGRFLALEQDINATDVVDLSRCPICQDDCFTDPVATDCGHLICWPCLNRYRSTARHNSSNCPVCRQTYGSVLSVNMKGNTYFLLMKVLHNLSGSKSMSELDSLAFGPRPKLSQIMARSQDHFGKFDIPQKAEILFHASESAESLDVDYNSAEEEICTLKDGCQSR